MNQNCLKILSLNIEKDKHLSRVIPFLRDQKPDVVLLQEVFLDNFSFFESELEMEGIFSVMKVFINEGRQRFFGLATFSSLPILKSKESYYFGTGKNPPLSSLDDPLNTARCILVTEVLKDNVTYSLVNTHFTWTPDGFDNSQQHLDLENLFHLLEKIPEFIMCGDFNAPRGRLIFDRIATKYKDNIPPYVTTTIDKNIHHAGDLQLVVDGLFSTSKYEVRSVQVLDGLSDHCAIIGEVFIK
jgi:endonuclease/exonuclease/phosphatase family metal-dependent hydrolase